VGLRGGKAQVSKNDDANPKRGRKYDIQCRSMQHAWRACVAVWALIQYHDVYSCAASDCGVHDNRLDKVIRWRTTDEPNLGPLSGRLTLVGGWDRDLTCEYGFAAGAGGHSAVHPSLRLAVR
jgi:hypothetical protein